MGLIFSAVDVPEGFLLEWWSINNDFEFFKQMHVSYPPPPSYCPTQVGLSVQLCDQLVAGQRGAVRRKARL